MIVKKSKNAKISAMLIAAAASSTLLLAACGSGTPDANGSTAPSDCPATPGVTATSVNLAIIFPQTGPAAATFAEFDKAAQLRFTLENDKGGVNGRTINATLYDDKSEGATQTTVANKAIQSDKVFGIVSASQADTMYPELNRSSVPVTGLANLPPYATDLNTFGMNGSFAGGYTSTAAAERFKKAGTMDIAVVAHASPGAQASARGFVKSMQSVGLNKSSSINDMPIGSFDATSMALKIKQSGANGVYSISLLESGTSLLSALKQQGVTMKTFMMALLSSPEAVKKAQGTLEGVIGAPAGYKPLTLADPAVESYVSEMNNAGLDPYVAFAPIGFMSADLMIRGLQEAGPCPTRESFITNLRKVTNYDGAGLGTAPVSFQPGANPTGDPSTCTWYVTVKNSELVPDPAVTCGTLVSVS